VRDRVRAPSLRGTCVKEDWCAWLPQEKATVFYNQVQHLEANYAMFSVSLNEAIELRLGGRLAQAHQTVEISGDLCRLLTEPLAGMLRALCEHAKHYGTVPNTAPLDPSNFQGLKSQRSARLSSLLNRVLLSHRMQFLHKVSALGEMVEDLERDFCRAASDLAEGTPWNRRGTWDAMDAGHYDLNTCLREAIVLLKSFLIALPEDQIAAFQNSVRVQSAPREAETPVRQVVIRHRRMTPIAGE